MSWQAVLVSFAVSLPTAPPRSRPSRPPYLRAVFWNTNGAHARGSMRCPAFKLCLCMCRRAH
eukprot:11893677-Alexandrium_andersonii.AAC.1